MPKYLESGNGGNIIQGSVSIDDETTRNCTEIVPGFHHVIDRWWAAVEIDDQSKPKARKHDRPIHGLEKLWTPEHAKTFGSFLPIPCQRGDATVTLPTIPHGSTPNKLAPGEGRRTLLPWYVAVNENDDMVDNEESDDWKTLASAHVSLSGVKSTPSDLSNRFGVIPYKFQAATSLKMESAVCQAILCRRSWNDPKAQLHSDLLLGDDRPARQG